MTDFLTSDIGQKILALVEACGGRYDDAGTGHRGILEDIETAIEDLEHDAIRLGENIGAHEKLVARSMLHEVGRCAIEHDDSRVRYITVQVARDLWNQIRAYLPDEERKP